MIIFTASVCVQAATIVVESNAITALNAMIIFSTFGGYWVMVLIGGILPQLSFYGVR